MKRKDFYLLVQPLTEKFYRFAYSLMPDEFQAEQLVIDGLNAFLIKEKKHILNLEIEKMGTKETQLLRRRYFKGILKYMVTIGQRRSIQLKEQLKISRPSEFSAFYDLDPKVRSVLGLRYQAQFTVEEIEDITEMPKYEVIEKIHNGRFLLLNNLNQGMSL
jgi:DNA-directed RNA polymerase specialized sigma24 family protein